MRTLHLFAGAGGGLLADLILGHTPVGAVEVAPYACAVLRERAAEGWFPGLRVHEGDVRDLDFSPWAGCVDQIAAGFPCQDISAAGSGAGIAGAHSGLVWEVFRAVDAVRPRFVFLENSPRIRTKGRRDIIAALVARRNAAAADVGAGHVRDRWWLLAADADGLRQLEQARRERDERGWPGDGTADAADLAGVGWPARWPELRQSPGQPETACRACQTPDALRKRLERALQQGGLSGADAETIETVARHTGAYDWSPPDAGVCRVVDGVAHRVDRIKCCGNGQIPLQAAAWLRLAGGPT